MIDRRDFLGITLGAGALALTPELLRAFHQSADGLIQRAIPSTGEKVPAIGLSFSNHTACANYAALKDVLKTMVDRGGRVFDAMHGSAEAEQIHANIANELGVQDKVFWSTRGIPGGPLQPGGASVNTHIDTWLKRIKASSLGLVMVPPQDATWLAALKEQKKAGRVRYIGVQVIVDSRFPEVESVMRSEPIDFIGVNFDVSSRRAEERILPLAQERKIGVMAFFPFSNNGGGSCGGAKSNLFARVGTRPLPEWAAEFDAKTWAQFFLKYVISHPAITVARVGTTNPAHMLDNIGGGIGRLPNEATRKRMAEFIDALPPVTVGSGPLPQSAHGPAGSLLLPAAILDRYVGEYTTPGGDTFNFRRYGTMLVAKVGPNPDTVIYGRTETRFQFGKNFIEFQSGSSGKASGLIYEQGTVKIAAARVR